MPSRPFLPLDLTFMDDDKILEAGPTASWLFLAILLACKRNGTDGTITRPQVARLAVDKWQRSVETLLTVGLLLDISEPDSGRQTLWIPSWSKWNLLAHEREEKRAKARSAAQTRWNKDAKRNANASANAMRPADAREEKRREEARADALEPVGEVLRRMRAL